MANATKEIDLFTVIFYGIAIYLSVAVILALLLYASGGGSFLGAFGKANVFILIAIVTIIIIGSGGRI